MRWPFPILGNELAVPQSSLTLNLMVGLVVGDDLVIKECLVLQGGRSL